MASSGEFIPEDGQDFELDQQPEYPTAFGITFTPTVTGVGLALLGAGVAAYLYINQVGPKQSQQQSLQQQRSDLQAQIDSQPDLTEELAIVERELQVSEARQQQLLSLLSSDESLSTLIADIERTISAVNASGSDPSVELLVGSLAPVTPRPVIVDDASFGESVDGRVKRWRLNLRMEGTFVQIRDFIGRLERFQPLLIVRDLNLQSAGGVPVRYVRDRNQFFPVEQPTLRGTFVLEAVLPATAEDITPSAEN